MEEELEEKTEDTEATKKTKKENPWKDFLEILVTAVILFIVLHVIFQSSFVSGPSMQPTYQNNDRLLVYKLAYSFSGEPERGDIIVFHPPLDGKEKEEFIKRVIGLPGEKVDIYGGKVYVTLTDGTVKTLEEPYISAAPKYEAHSGVIPEGYYFVLGDNRLNSNDSHNGWLVPEKNIIGKACLNFFPFSIIGGAPNYDFDF